LIRIGKLERQFSTSGDNQYGEWAGLVSVGKDLNTFWLTAKGSTQHGDADSAEIRLFYSRTIKPYIGVQLGWRRDLKPEPELDWLGFGLLGVLPYKIGADASFFIGESSRLAARLEIAYQHWFTHKLSLTPDLEANFYSKDDPDRSIGSGLADLDLGLRLRYWITKGISPYTGFTWKGNFGNTADMLESEGEDTGDLRIMLGVTLRI
jgi:copper resistance protein B